MSIAFFTSSDMGDILFQIYNKQGMEGRVGRQEGRLVRDSVSPCRCNKYACLVLV
jgi:hypothetical protein